MVAQASSHYEAGAEELPAAVGAVMQHVRFKPALRNGEPVEGGVKFTLAGLAD